MQITLFPDESLQPEAHVAIQRGRIGPIRFAATPTSYPHLCQALMALTVKPDETRPAAARQD